MKYDVAIIGGGIGGLMAAYRLKQNCPDTKIIIIEKDLTLQSVTVLLAVTKNVSTAKSAV